MGKSKENGWMVGKLKSQVHVLSYGMDNRNVCRAVRSGSDCGVQFWKFPPSMPSFLPEFLTICVSFQEDFFSVVQTS